MKRILSLTTGIALALLAMTAQAATTTGVVVSTDSEANVVTLRTADGRNFSFERNDVTTIEPADRATWFADLRPGASITVTSDQAPTDPAVRLLATHVKLLETVAEAPPVAIAANDTRERTADRLPTTATPLPLLMLTAIGSIVAGLGLRMRRR